MEIQKLKKLLSGEEPEPEKPTIDDIRGFLKQIEEKHLEIDLFHSQKKVPMEDQYIPIQVNQERKYHHQVETTGMLMEDQDEKARIYDFRCPGDKEGSGRIDWEEARKKHERMMVLADPGMGKSTLLHWEALNTARREMEKLKDDGSNLDDVIFPIFIRLSELTKDGEVIDILTQHVKNDYPEAPASVLSILTDRLKDGKCLLLLDALDEVSRTGGKGTDGNIRNPRQELADKLKRFTDNYKCPIICTSRIVGYSGSVVDSAKEVEIVPFGDNQRETYIRNWFRNAGETIEDASVTPQNLIKEIKAKPQVQGLARIPLLLSLICSLYIEKDIELPARRCEIYEKAVDCMLKKWTEGKRYKIPQNDSRRLAKISLLENLAYDFSCIGKESFSLRELQQKVSKHRKSEECADELGDNKPGELIEEITVTDGIIRQLEEDNYIFLHRTFQEYFTASYTKRSKDTIQLAQKHFWHFDWHETLSLLAGMMDDPIPLIKAIVGEEDDIFSSMLLLAGLCIAECRENSNPLFREVADNIFRFWFDNIGKADFITPYLISIGSMMDYMTELIINALEHWDRDIRSNSAYTLGSIGNEKAVDALIEALDDQDSDVRWSAASALGSIGTKSAVDTLIKALDDQSGNVRRDAASALGRIGNERAVNALVKALDDQDSDVRWWAASALKCMGNEKAVDAFIKALENENSFVRWEATRVLGSIGNENAVVPLIKALEDNNGPIGISAASALVSIGNERAVDALIVALDHQNWYVKSHAAEALGRIGNERAVDALIKALENENSFSIRKEVTKALGRIGNERAVDALIKALDDQSGSVRSDAVETLASIGNKKSVDALIKALEDQDWYVRWKATESLASIGNKKSVDPLIKALGHWNSDVRSDAAETLASIGSEKVVDALIEALGSWNSDVGSRAAEILANIGSEKVVDALIKALEDGNSNVRSRAVNALGSIGNENAVKTFIRTLDHQDSYVSQRAAYNLKRLGKLETLGRIVESSPDINEWYIYDLIRHLMVRFSRSDVDTANIDFLPVYPRIVAQHRPNTPRPQNPDN